jgi:hypothetical protein
VVISPRSSPAPRCWPAALAAVPGLVLLAFVWALFLDFAQNMSVDPANGGSVVFLRGLVAAQAALTVGCAVFIRPQGRLRPGLLPAVVWLLFALDATLLCMSGFY